MNANNFVEHLAKRIQLENDKKDDPFLKSLLSEIETWRKSPTVTPLFMIPKDVLIHMIAKLPLHYIAIVSQLCKYTKTLCENDYIWREKAIEISASEIKSQTVTVPWKQYYKDNRARWRIYPDRIAYYIMELEKGVKWSGVFDSWRQRRSPWIEDCRKVKTVADVIPLLIELETVLVPEALLDEWKPKRLVWREAVRRITDYKSLRPYLVELRDNLHPTVYTLNWISDASAWSSDIYAEDSTRYVRFQDFYYTPPVVVSPVATPPPAPAPSISTSGKNCSLQ